MKVGGKASHRLAGSYLEGRRPYEHVLEALEAPDVPVVHGGSATVRAHIEDYLQRHGWASPVTVTTGFNVKLNLTAGRTVLQVQTGNVARAFYDLMKMQALHQQGRADCGVLVVPMAAAARVVGGNLAQFERVSNELEGVFYHQITIPILIVGFE